MFHWETPQTFKELTPILQNLFQEREDEETLLQHLNINYQAKEEKLHDPIT